MATASSASKKNSTPDTAPSANAVAPVAGFPQSDAMSAVATVGVVVVGAAILEAALIPAILVGAAAALAPKFLPGFGARFQPVVDMTVKGAVKAGRKAYATVGQAKDKIGDITAEVVAEEAAGAVV